VKHLLRVLALVALTFTAVPAQAQLQGEYPGLETGKMWTFDVPPLEYWAKRYDFKPSTQWLDHVRLSAVRYGGGCSASFVSPNGLVMTNHHCARACIESATKEGEDFLSNGFYARTKEEERACQGLFLDQLQEITDVTPRVMQAIAGAKPAQAGKLRTDAIAAIEKECQGEAKDKACQVVTFYRGGQYKLYTVPPLLRRAPRHGARGADRLLRRGSGQLHLPAARHRHVVRAGVRERPAGQHAAPLHVEPRGTKEGDLTFIIGNPGSTGRLNSMSQLQYLRDVSYPSQMKALDRRIETLEAYMQADTVKGKAYRNTLFSLQNTRKAIGGYQTGLLDKELMTHKAQWGEGVHRQGERRPGAEGEVRPGVGPDRDGAGLAREDGGAPALRAVPDGRRPPAAHRQSLRALPVGDGQARRRAPPRVQGGQPQADGGDHDGGPADGRGPRDRQYRHLPRGHGCELPATHPVRKAALGGRTPAEAAKYLVENSVLVDATARKALFEAGGDAIAKSNDPFIALARTIDPLERGNAKFVQRQLDAETAASERVAQALLATHGNGVSPDATFSLRISDGEVKRYPLNGTYAPAYTTFSGLYDRSRAFEGAGPWRCRSAGRSGRRSSTTAHRSTWPPRTTSSAATPAARW
jgi:hypothetical protein